MKRVPKLLLGLVTIWPIFYMLLFMGSVVYSISSMMPAAGSPSGSEPFMFRHFQLLFVLHIFTMVVIVSVLTIYIVHVFRSPRVPQEKRVLWLIVLLLGGLIAMPIYWYLYVWPDSPTSESPAVAPASPPVTGTSKAAIAGLVLGILGFGCFPIGIVGLVLGVLALTNKVQRGGKTVAIVAVVLGALSIPVNGMLAAVAIPAALRYTRRAKSVEARANVAALYAGVVQAYRDAHELPPSLPRTPAAPACGAAQAWPSGALPGWQALGFSPTEPVRYAYEYVSDGHSFTVRAVGDLDCDEILSTFERAGAVRGDRIEAQGGLVVRLESE